MGQTVLVGIRTWIAENLAAPLLNCILKEEASWCPEMMLNFFVLIANRDACDY